MSAVRANRTWLIELFDTFTVSNLGVLEIDTNESHELEIKAMLSSMTMAKSRHNGSWANSWVRRACNTLVLAIGIHPQKLHVQTCCSISDKSIVASTE